MAQITFVRLSLWSTKFLHRGEPFIDAGRALRRLDDLQGLQAGAARRAQIGGG